MTGKIILMTMACCAVAGAAMKPLVKNLTVQAETLEIDAERVRLEERDYFSGGKAIILREGVKSRVNEKDAKPDIVLRVKAAAPIRCVMITVSGVDEATAVKMSQSRNKYDSLYMKVQVGSARPTKRVIFAPWGRVKSYRSKIGKFTFDGTEQSVGIWLPEGVFLDYLAFSEYKPPAVPDAVKAYKPSVVPPATHPRLWVNAESLEAMRARVKAGSNLGIWEQIRSDALKPYNYNPEPDAEITYSSGLEESARRKAFVYLIDPANTECGREAVALMSRYLEQLDFGNILDITREIGRAIYTAAIVFDWCNPLMSEQERALFVKHMRRLADDMECGWPPFRQTIVNGHGNEAQINRDLLSMSIALYEVDPEPYRYCSYLILEQLVPMRKFEYQSPRHNQGTAYGQVRFAWDLHSAWLMRRMCGHAVFDKNIGDVYQYWIYTRLPNGSYFSNGDCWYSASFAKNPFLALLSASYDNNPYYKEDFVRQGGLNWRSLERLLLDEPSLVPRSIGELPLSIDYGDIYGGMGARTGWNLGESAHDVVVQILGGGYHSANHQHACAGAFQIYCRARLAASLGQYHYYGTPYDSCYAKRSISQSMLLVRDPDEKAGSINDGGARDVRRTPLSQKILQEDALYHYGKVLSCTWGPSHIRPLFSYYSAELAEAYGPKVKSFVRNFCFVNFGGEEHPAVIVVLDSLEASNPAFKQYWQINSCVKPEKTARGVRLLNDAEYASVLDVDIVLPAEHTVEILSGEATCNVFGQQFTAPRNTPDQLGHRVMFSPVHEAAAREYLAVMQVGIGKPQPLKYETGETAVSRTIRVQDRFISLPKGASPIETAFAFDVPAGTGTMNVFVAGLKPGMWCVTGADGTPRAARVLERDGTIFFQTAPGHCTLAPSADAGLAPLPKCDDVVPSPIPELQGQINIDGKPSNIRGILQNDITLVSLPDFLKAVKAPFTQDGRRITLKRGDFTVTVDSPADKDEMLVDGSFRLKSYGTDKWHCDICSAALLANVALRADALADSWHINTDKHIFNDDVLMILQASNPDTLKLASMLGTRNGNLYWDAAGRNVSFTLHLKPGINLSGVQIQWLSGDKRVAHFAIDTAPENGDFKEAFKGDSSGKDAGAEKYLFKTPVKNVRYLRFRGFGNSINAWNSIISFKLIK